MGVQSDKLLAGGKEAVHMGAVERQARDKVAERVEGKEPEQAGTAEPR